MKENSVPTMENGKCKEHCSHKDDMGFCMAGDACLKYGVNNVTFEPLRDPKLDEVDEAKNLIPSLGAIQNLLFAHLVRLSDTKLSAKERQEERETAREVAAITKQMMTGVSLALDGYKLMTDGNADKKGIKGLIE